MGAIFSEDRTRRYLLTRDLDRDWRAERKTLGWVMLNPSRAGEKEDDPTIRKCLGFAKRWGFSEIQVANLIPVVSTDPWDLPPWIGRYMDNARYLSGVIKVCDAIVVAWGAVPRGLSLMIALTEHRLHFRELVGNRQLFCIGTTKNGSPLHPSRTAYTSDMQEWEWPS